MSAARDRTRTDAGPVADYVERLTDEVYAYTVSEPSHARAVHRIYNVLRLTGRDAEADRLRHLFAASAPELERLDAVIAAIDAPVAAGGGAGSDAVIAQLDQLIMALADEPDVLPSLLRLRDALGRGTSPDASGRDIAALRDEAARSVNRHVERLLTSVPGIRAFLENVAAMHEEADHAHR